MALSMGSNDWHVKMERGFGDIKGIERVLGEVRQFILDNDFKFQKWATKYFDKHYQRISEDIGFCCSKTTMGSRIIDIGAAPFFTTIAIKKLGYDIVGADIAPERFSELLDYSGLSVSKCDIEHAALPFPNSEFDVVLFNEVFEHLRIDPIFTLSEIYRVLKPQGYLVLSTVNYFEVARVLRLIIKRKTSPVFEEYNKLRKVGHMGHVREYTVRDVEEFASKIGYNCEKVVFRGMAPWRSRPYALVKAVFHRVLPASRPWFTLFLTKGQKS